MKAYGMPRILDLEFPDKGDLCFFALKSSKGHIKTKSGEYKNHIRSINAKAKARRIFKRLARQTNKEIINSYLQELEKEE